MTTAWKAGPNCGLGRIRPRLLRKIEPGSAIGTAEVNTLEPVQAYVGYEVRDPFGRGSRLALQTGRFTLNLGSRRLIAADDYRNTTNSYTGLRADIRAGDGTAATLIYTLPQVRLPDDLLSILDNKVQLDRESFDSQLWGGLVSRPRVVAGAMAEIGYFGLAERDAPGRPTRNRHLHNVSARLIRDPAPGKADFEVEGIYQFGSVRSSLAATAPQLDVSAWFVHADAGYTFQGPLKARLSVEYDYASGDGSGRSYGRFDTLFGMRRADLAPAGIYAQIGRANISTPGIRLEMAPTSRLDGFVVYRAMWLAERTDAFSTTGVRDPSGRSGSFAGHQIEGRVRWWAIPNRLRAEINGAWIGKRRFLEAAPNAQRPGNTRYISIAMSASF
ncbi:MAG: hypothetical protein B7Z20_10680 [Sphingobium sp. 32-64-5]|nr:MAG: hypothetical protein B7Z20_10680 [Sphingobium sp. 32-64-5]